LIAAFTGRLPRVAWLPACLLALVALLGAPARLHAQSTWTVTTTSDDATGVAANCQPGSLNPCTLRDAIASAASGDTITFQSGLTGTISVGSAMAIQNTTLTIAGPGGGAIVLTPAAANTVVLAIWNSTASISGLSFANGQYVDGDAILTSGSNVTLTNVVFSNNSGMDGIVFNGGGSTMTIDNCAFINNSAPFGGAIYGGGPLTITNSVFSGNSAPGYMGGAIYLIGGSALVENSTFVGNSSSTGGAIYLDAGGSGSGLTTQLTVVNSTFYGNTGSYGGAIVASEDFGSSVTYSGLTIYNSTIVGNSPFGIAESGALNVYNSILSGNFNGSNESDCISNGGDPCPTNGAGGNVVGVNANLAPLAGYGGPTQTMIPLPGSPAICAGLAANVYSGMTTDQRGWPITLTPSTCPSGQVDAGAVQTNYSVINTLVDSLNGTDATSCSDGSGSACSLRDALTQLGSGQADVGFAPSLFVSGTPSVPTPGTITLGQGTAGDTYLPSIAGTLNLVGPGASLLTVSGNNDSNVGSIFTVSSGANAVFEGTTVANGHAEAGGAILNSGTATVEEDVFSGNQAGARGGAIRNQGGSISILNSTFVNNSSANRGGAFFNGQGAATVINSTFNGNQASIGGGAIGNIATLAVYSSTISGNTVLGNPDWIDGEVAGGGGIDQGPQSASSLVLNNSIAAGNTVGGTATGTDCYGCSTPNTTINQSLIGLPSGLTNANQILGTLGASPASAAVQVMMPLPDSPSSPTLGILCQGSASLLPAGVTTDERGFPMDPQCSSGAIDLGAAQANYTQFQTIGYNGVVNQTITPSPTAELWETNALTGVTDGVFGIPLSLYLNGAAPPIATETTAATTVNGVTDNLATYPGLSVGTPGTGDWFALAVGSYSAPGTIANYNLFNIDSATVTQLAFTTPPAVTIVAGATQPAVTVQEESVSGVPILSAADSITMTVTGPNGYSQNYGPLTAVNGAVTFTPQTLTTAGPYSYNALNTAGVGTTASQTVTAQTTVSGLAVYGYPSPQYAGVPGTVTVSLADQYGNPVSAGSGTATVTTSDPLATSNGTVIPTAGLSVTLANGSGTASIAFNTTGTQSITATATGLGTASQTGITINLAPNFVVNTSADDSGTATNCTPQSSSTSNTTDTACSLRDALAAAGNAGGGNVGFDSSVFSISNTAAQNTITLGSTGTLDIPSGTSINGPGASQLTVSGANSFTVFYASNSTVAVSNLTITNGYGNTGECWSGGIEVDYGTLTLTNSIITGNTGYFGVGICNYSGTLTVTNSTVTGNSGYEGVGILNWGGTATVTNSTAAQNYASEGYGGGIATWYTGTLTVTGSTITGNTVYYYGGGIESYESTLTVTGSTIAGNTANGDGYGGGIEIYGGTATLADNTVAGNTSSYYGGGIENDYGAATLTNNTVTGSYVASGPGGGIENYEGTVTAANNIVAGNWTYGSADDIDGGYSDSGGNFVGYSDGSQLNTAAANLAPLANYGGPTQTVMPLPGSPAICLGLASNVPAGVTTDQRGWPITLTPSTCPAGQVDAGAVQTNYSLINTLADSLNTGDATSCSDGTVSATNTCSLRDALVQLGSGQADVGFAPSLFVSGTPAVPTPGTITLGQGTGGDNPLPSISGTVNLMGPGANLLTVSGNSDSKVGSILQLANTAAANVAGITFANGVQNPSVYSDYHGGGAIASQGTLTVQNDVFTGNQSVGISGGAIVNAGTMNVLDSTFLANTSGNYGGAFFNCCVSTATIVNSTFTGNTSANDGGAIFAFSKLTVDNSTVVGNTSTAGTGGGINTYCAGATSAINNSIVAGNSANGVANSDDVDYASCGGSVAPAENADLIGLPTGVTNANQILGALGASPASATVPVMMPLPDSASTPALGILCQGSASLVPAGIITDARGFPADPQCSSGAIDLGAAQTNYGEFQTTGYNGYVNQTINPSPTAEVWEMNNLTGAWDGVFGIPVTLSLNGPGTLNGTATVTTAPTTVNGVTDNMAVYGGLSVSAVGASDSFTLAIGSYAPAYVYANTFAITVSPVTLSPASPLPGAVAGVAYSQQLTASGGTAPYTYAVTGGSLPAGLTLSQGGLISGTPTTGGTANFTVTATDSYNQSGSLAYTLTVSPSAITLTTPSPLPGAVAGVAYSQQFTASGGTAPYTYAVTGGSLPAGLTLSTSGLMSGTPTTAGTANFTVTATDSNNQSGSLAYALTVTANFTLSSGSGSGGSSGYTASVTVQPGQAGTFIITFTPQGASTFPAAVTLTAAGLPAGATASFSPSATIAAGSGTTSLTLAIQTAPLAANNQGGKWPFLPAAGTLALLLLPFARRLRKAARLLLVLLTVGLALAGFSGCGSGTGFFGQATKSYTVTVTGTSGTLSNSTAVTLTVE
jgi:predicted outer membrane repeat protein